MAEFFLDNSKCEYTMKTTFVPGVYVCSGCGTVILHHEDICPYCKARFKYE